jgi:hypothetical protein
MAKAFRSCPKCNKPNHVKRSCCTDCGHKFQSAVSYSKKDIVTEVVNKPAKPKTRSKKVLGTKREYLPNGDIFTPAGKCPVKLTSPVYEHVYKWAKALIKHFDNRLCFEAFVYYLNEFFPRYGNWNGVSHQFKEAEANLILVFK